MGSAVLLEAAADHSHCRVSIVYIRLTRMTPERAMAKPRNPSKRDLEYARALFEEANALGDPDAIAVAKFFLAEADKPKRTSLRSLFARLVGRRR